MGGTLGPLVQGSFVRLRQRVLVSVMFGFAFLLGALITFNLASFLNVRLIQPWVSTEWRTWITVGGFALLSILDLIAIRRNTYCSLTLSRQTPKSLARHRGMLFVAAFWGFDLGTAISTFRVTAMTWGALLLVILGWAPPWIALSYAAGFVIPLLFLMWAGRFPRREQEQAFESLRQMLDRREPAQWISAGLLAFGAILTALGKLG